MVPERDGGKLAAPSRRHAARRVGRNDGKAAFITSTVSDILGSASRSFREWVTDHATMFREGPASDEA